MLSFNNNFIIPIYYSLLQTCWLKQVINSLYSYKQKSVP